MASERIHMPNATLQGIGQALIRAIPMPGHDREERAERHELRKIDVREQLK